MNEQHKSFLVIRANSLLSQEMMERLTEMGNKVEDITGLECIVHDASVEVIPQYGIQPIIELLREQVQAINNLAASNMAIVDALTQSLEDDGISVHSHLGEL